MTVSDLPAGVNGDVTVTTGGGFSAHVTATVLLDSIPVGACTITENTTATVAASVSYAPVDGKLNVIVGGLPAGVDAYVEFHHDADPAATWRIVSTTLTSSLPPGPYTIVAASVVASGAGGGGELYHPAQAQYQATVAAGQTAQVTVLYEEEPEQEEEEEASCRVFHGPVNFTGAQVDAYYVLLEEYGFPLESLNERDTFSFPYPDGYVVDQDCRIVGTDVTEAGVAVTTSISSAFGSGSAGCELTASGDGTRVTITGSATAAAGTIGAYVGNGTTVGLLYFGYPDGGNLYDLALAIENPTGAAYELRFSWSYEGSETGGDYAGWKQYFTYQLDPQVCISNPSVQSLMHANDFSGPASGSGSHSIALSGKYHLISFGLHSEATGGWSMDHLGRGNMGNASSSATVIIEIIHP